MHIRGVSRTKQPVEAKKEMPIWLCRLLFISHTRSHAYTYILSLYILYSRYTLSSIRRIYTPYPLYILRPRYNTTVYSVNTNRPDTPRDRRQAWREWKSWRRIAGAILTPAAESGAVKGAVASEHSFSSIYRQSPHIRKTACVYPALRPILLSDMLSRAGPDSVSLNVSIVLPLSSVYSIPCEYNPAKRQALHPGKSIFLDVLNFSALI